jgi:hypothetical protein
MTNKLDLEQGEGLNLKKVIRIPNEACKTLHLLRSRQINEFSYKVLLIFVRNSGVHDSHLGDACNSRQTLFQYDSQRRVQGHKYLMPTKGGTPAAWSRLEHK